MPLRSFKNIAFWSLINTMHKHDVQLYIVHIGRNLIHELIKMRPRAHACGAPKCISTTILREFPCHHFFRWKWYIIGSRGIWHIISPAWQMNATISCNVWSIKNLTIAVHNYVLWWFFMDQTLLVGEKRWQRNSWKICSALSEYSSRALQFACCQFSLWLY